MSRPICKFFQSGYCKNGNSCKFEHPNANANRFSAFGGGGGGGGAFGGGGGVGGGFGRGQEPALPFALSKDILLKDLTDDKPEWILSSYGPGRDAPEQLFGGFPREQSYEEIRLVYLEGLLTGNPQGALNQIEALKQDANNQIQNAVHNIDSAIQFVLGAQHKTPNRNSTLQNNTNGSTFAVGRTANAFGAQPTNLPTTTGGGFGGGGFGQPTAFGQPKPGGFGTPSFGQPSQPTSGFGQPSALGGGGGGTSAFGQPSALGAGTSAFGQPSTMGARPSAFGTPAFGQAAAPMGGGTSAFGQPSALGAKPNPFGAGGGGAATTASPFSAMANNNAGASPFGQMGGGTAQAAPANPFGAAVGPPTAFGQPSALGGGGTSGFGQPSALGAKPSAFGATTTTSAFGAPSTNPNPNAFGAPAPDTSMDMSMSLTTPTAPSGFGAPSSSAPAATAAASNPFGAAATATAAAAPANPFSLMKPAATTTATTPFGGATTTTTAGAPASGTSPYAPTATRQHPPASSYLAKHSDGTLATFKGKSVAYQTPREGQNAGKPFPVLRNFDGSVVRIWNPDGPPAYYKDTEGSPPSLYDDRETKAAYEVFVGTKRFAGGVIPETPPLREWCSWDF